MQQLLVLRRRPRRGRFRSHRLDALALAWQHQAHAIVAQRSGPVGVANDAHKAIDIGRKPRFTVIPASQIHRRPHARL